MQNLITYCCDKGIQNFQTFKFQRKSRIVMLEHFVSKKDVEKYELLPYVILDRYGRYKIPKYILKELSSAIHYAKYYFSVEKRNNRIYSYTINDVEQMLLNPSCHLVDSILNNLKHNLDKDPIRNRVIKIIQIKNKLKNYG